MHCILHNINAFTNRWILIVPVHVSILIKPENVYSVHQIFVNVRKHIQIFMRHQHLFIWLACKQKEKQNKKVFVAHQWNQNGSEFHAHISTVSNEICTIIWLIVLILNIVACENINHAFKCMGRFSIIQLTCFFYFKNYYSTPWSSGRNVSAATECQC